MPVVIDTPPTIQCQAERGHEHGRWRYQIVDGRRCWYSGGPVRAGVLGWARQEEAPPAIRPVEPPPVQKPVIFDNPPDEDKIGAIFRERFPPPLPAEPLPLPGGRKITTSGIAIVPEPDDSVFLLAVRGALIGLSIFAAALLFYLSREVWRRRRDERQLSASKKATRLQTPKQEMSNEIESWIP